MDLVSIGKRFAEARKMCDLTTTAAAKLIGAKNSVHLMRIEAGEIAPSLEYVILCSRAYSVTTDFLLCQSSDFEFDQNFREDRDVSACLFEYWERTRKRDLCAIRSVSDQVHKIKESTEELASVVDSIALAFQQFASDNPEFEDMRNGAKLQARIYGGREKVSNVRLKIRRFEYAGEKATEYLNDELGGYKT